jgi:hypothetical protein
LENEKSFNSGNTLGAAARVRENQERARVGGWVGGALADRLSPVSPVNECSDVRGSYQDPLRVRIERRLSRISEDAQDLLRMQAILGEHPEFEQLLELMTLVNRRGL